MQSGEASQSLTDRDRPLQARQGRPDAKVDAVAERDVIARLARDVETIGVGKLRRIVVGCGQNHEAPGACRNQGAPDLNLTPGPARGGLHRSVVTEHLLYR